MTYTNTTTNEVEDLLSLIDSYAEARHVGGCHTYNAKTAAARNAVVAALASAAAPAGGAVAGWKWVPMVPTDTMSEAGSIAGNGHDWSGPDPVYAAMLAAAPPAQAGESVDRADAVNLARNTLTHRDRVITKKGVRVLAEAVLSMDAALINMRPTQAQALSVLEDAARKQGDKP